MGLELVRVSLMARQS